MIVYNYAGFDFEIKVDDVDQEVGCSPRVTYYAVALPNQHKAAYKAKHAQAALECWNDDDQPGLR